MGFARVSVTDVSGEQDGLDDVRARFAVLGEGTVGVPTCYVFRASWLMMMLIWAAV